MTKLRIFKGCL